VKYDFSTSPNPLLLRRGIQKVPLLLACPVKFEEYFTGVGEGVSG